MAELPASLDHLGGLGAPAVPSARQPHDDHLRALDEIGDDERWLWRVVHEAERVVATAPVGPDQQRVAVVEDRFAQARAIEQRITDRIRVTEAALARPGSWLRPSHRADLLRHLRGDRTAAVAAAVQRSRVEEVLRRMRTLTAARADHLAMHRVVLAAGANARAEIEQLIDDLICQYTRMPEQPVWFRFGLGYPPERGTESAWLEKARAAISERRRRLLNDPVGWLR